MPGILFGPRLGIGAPPHAGGVLLEGAADVFVGSCASGHCRVGAVWVAQSLYGAFTAVGRVGMCKGQWTGEGIRPWVASPCPAPSSSCFHPAGCGGCWCSVGLGRAGLGSGPTAEAAFLSSALQTDSVASAPTSKPSSSSPARDSLTPGPGPSSAIPLRPPPAKAPSTDTVSECPGTARGQLCCDSPGAGMEGGRTLSATSRAGRAVLLHKIPPMNHGHTPAGLRPAGSWSGCRAGVFCCSLRSCHFSGAA